MSLVRKFLARGRLRKARMELAANPSPMSYAALANQYAWAGSLHEALRVSEEGLELFQGNPELRSLVTRLQRMQREESLAELREELEEAPRPAVWAEICDILLDSAQYSRAEETAREWIQSSQDPEAHLVIARACVERYLTDLGREAGRRAIAAIDQAQAALSRDPRPIELRLRLVSSIGAWEEAREAVQSLLELSPGDPKLESRFRHLSAMPSDAPSIERALIEVQRTGQLVQEEDEEDEVSVAVGEVRPVLQNLSKREGVRAAVYVRSSTALVQGLRGATAERAARSVRTIVQSGRAAARSLGLGQISEVEMVGDYGTLLVSAGAMDAGALWCRSTPLSGDRQSLMNLVGVGAGNAS